jgi:hypothetical protein
MLWIVVVGESGAQVRYTLSQDVHEGQLFTVKRKHLFTERHSIDVRTGRYPGNESVILSEVTVLIHQKHPFPLFAECIITDCK